MRRFIVCLFVLLMGTGLVQGQSSPVNCNGLDERDCAILQKNQLAMMALESFRFDMAGTALIEDLPDFDGDLPFSLTLQGAIIADFRALQQFSDTSDETEGSDAASVDVVARLAEEIDFDLSMVLKLPQLLVDNYDGELPQNLRLNMVLTGGDFFVDLTTLRDMLGEQGRTLPTGWYGVDLAELILLSQDPPTPSRSRPDGAAPDTANTPQGQPFLDSYDTLERLEDGVSATGERLAIFRTTSDYSEIWDDPVVRELVFQAIEDSGERLSNREMDALDRAMRSFVEGIQFESTETIGLESYYTYATDVSLSFDLSPLVASMGNNLVAPSETVMTLDFQSTYSQFNSVAPIERPPRAILIPLDMFEQMGPPLQQAKPIP